MSDLLSFGMGKVIMDHCGVRRKEFAICPSVCPFVASIHQNMRPWSHEWWSHDLHVWPLQPNTCLQLAELNWLCLKPPYPLPLPQEKKFKATIPAEALFQLMVSKKDNFPFCFLNATLTIYPLNLINNVFFRLCWTTTWKPKSRRNTSGKWRWNARNKWKSSLTSSSRKSPKNCWGKSRRGRSSTPSTAETANPRMTNRDAERCSDSLADRRTDWSTDRLIGSIHNFYLGEWNQLLDVHYENGRNCWQNVIKSNFDLTTWLNLTPIRNFFKLSWRLPLFW